MDASKFDLRGWRVGAYEVRTRRLNDELTMRDIGCAVLVTREVPPADAPWPIAQLTISTAIEWFREHSAPRSVELRDRLLAMVPPPSGRESCPACGGEEVVDCACCSGRGSYVCDSRTCGRAHECDNCHGDGVAECEECKDKPAATPAWVDIDGSFFDARHLTPLRGMGAVSARIDKYDGEPAALVLHDGDAALVLVVLKAAKPEHVVGRMSLNEGDVE